MNRLGVYIHIPFCKQKCHYCDFVSFAGQERLFETYKNALVSEIRSAPELRGAEIDTVFIGGGTPSVLPPSYVTEILYELRRYKLSLDAEITIEANPGTVNYESLSEYAASGINRLSLGLQAVQDTHLQSIGRIHRFGDFTESFAAARAAGFKNISVDLMFALPNQTVDEFRHSLEAVIQLKPQHISAYSLIIEENTELGRKSAEGTLITPDDETDRLMYHMAVALLKIHGYNRYEISNFASRGFASRHNLKYWRMKSYLGLGLNSHSKLGKNRFENTSNFDEYLCESANLEALRRNKIKLSQKDEMAEFMFLGLRTAGGISIGEFRRMFGCDITSVYGGVLDKFIENGLLVQNKHRIFLSEQGIDLSNRVMAEFL